MKRVAHLSGALFWIMLLTAARAETVADFYRGKTIELAIAGAPAGGYDVAARTLANHFSRHIPGNPTVIVKNMPGAAGLVVTNYLYNVAKRDGTVIGMPTSNVPIEPRLKLLSPDGSNVKFDLANFSWIGTPLQEPQVTWVWHTAPAASVDDLKANIILMGCHLRVGGQRHPAAAGRRAARHQDEGAARLSAARTRSTSPPSAARCRATIPACPISPSTRRTGCATHKVRILLQLGSERLPGVAGRADGRSNSASSEADQRAAAVLRPRSSPWRGRC